MSQLDAYVFSGNIYDDGALQVIGRASLLKALDQLPGRSDRSASHQFKSVVTFLHLFKCADWSTSAARGHKCARHNYIVLQRCPWMLVHKSLHGFKQLFDIISLNVSYCQRVRLTFKVVAAPFMHTGAAASSLYGVKCVITGDASVFF